MLLLICSAWLDVTLAHDDASKSVTAARLSRFFLWEQVGWAESLLTVPFFSLLHKSLQGLTGTPLVAGSPIRHDSAVQGNAVEVQTYQPPWKALSDFALQSDLDQPAFQQLVRDRERWEHTAKRTRSSFEPAWEQSGEGAPSWPLWLKPKKNIATHSQTVCERLIPP